MAHRQKNAYTSQHVHKKWKNRHHQDYWWDDSRELDTKARHLAKIKPLRRYYKMLIEHQFRKQCESDSELETENSEYITANQQQFANGVCINCNYVNNDDTKFCAICNLSLEESSFTFEPKRSRPPSKLNLEQIIMSKRGKCKMKKYSILQKHFLPILKQFCPTFFVKYTPHKTRIDQFRPSEFLRKLPNADAVAKYYPIESEITCVAPDYMLKRLDLIFHENTLLLNEKPLIVFTSRYNMRQRRRRLTEKAERKMFRENKIIQYYLQINRILVRGFGLYHFTRDIVPDDVNDLILAFYGNTVKNVFDLLMIDPSINKQKRRLVHCSEQIRHMNEWLKTEKDVVIGLSMHKEVIKHTHNNTTSDTHLMMPIFNVKLKHVNDEKALYRCKRFHYI